MSFLTVASAGYLKSASQVHWHSPGSPVCHSRDWHQLCAKRSLMQGSRIVSLLPGDGIGPEVTQATVQVLEALKAPLEFERCEIGAEVFAKRGTNLPLPTIESIVRN